MFNIGSSFFTSLLVRNLNRVSAAGATAALRLGTGLRINTIVDDPVGSVTSNLLGAQISSTEQANANAGVATSLVQVAEGGASSISDILERLKTLAQQASDSTTSSATRSSIQSEADALLSEIDRIANATSFGGQSLLSTTQTFTFFIGDGTTGSGQTMSVQLNALQANQLVTGITSFSIATTGNISQTITSLSSGIDSITAVIGRIGAAESRLERVTTDISSRLISLEGAQSAIRDADLALEASNLARAQILGASGVFGLSQAFLFRQNILPLLGFPAS